MSASRWPIAGVLVVALSCARQSGESDSAAGASAAAAASGDSSPPAVIDSGRADSAVAATDTTRTARDAAPRPSARRDSASVTATQPPGSDAGTMRGTVKVVGSSPFARVALTPAGGRAVTLTGPDSAALRRAAALEVEVRGAPSGDGREFAVTSFTVLRANGEPAIDGTLVRDGDGLAVETAQGRVRLGNPPEPLRQQVGARVWLGGPPETGPNPYGILVPAP